MHASGSVANAATASAFCPPRGLTSRRIRPPLLARRQCGVVSSPKFSLSHACNLKLSLASTTFASATKVADAGGDKEDQDLEVPPAPNHGAEHEYEGVEEARRRGDDALSAILVAVTDAGSPFFLSSPASVSPHVIYRLEPGVAPGGGALWSCVGERAYSTVARRWRSTARSELWECEQRVMRCSRTGPDEAVVRWETEYIPAKLRWLWDLGQAWPGVEVTTYDILDRMGELSRFSWKGLFTLFFRAAVKGEMRLPAALIQSTSRLRFSRDSGGSAGVAGQEETALSTDAGGGLLLVSHEETVDLIACVNTDRVKNRRVARDLLEYLDTRKPPDTSLEAWDNAVEDAVRYSAVPGMGMFDVDGLEDAEDRAGVYADAAAVLAFGVVIVLTFGVGFGSWYLAGLQNDAMWREMLETGAY